MKMNELIETNLDDDERISLIVGTAAVAVVMNDWKAFEHHIKAHLKAVRKHAILDERQKQNVSRAS